MNKLSWIMVFCIAMSFSSCERIGWGSSDWVTKVREATVDIKTFGRTQSGKRNEGWGMGFFVQDADTQNMYLITCRHMLKGCDVIEVWYLESRQMRSFNLKPKYWVDHPDTLIDIVAIPLKTDGWSVSPISIDCFGGFAEGGEVFSLTSYRTTHNGRGIYSPPVDTASWITFLNSGIVSRIPTQKLYRERGVFYTTLITKQGNSGTPVFKRHERDSDFVIIGIAVGGMKDEEISTVISADKIIEVIDICKKKVFKNSG